MAIHKLPDYVINRLKAWEIVERPASILKELVENSIDAWSTHLEITINDWWKSYLSVQDNGSWIELSDMDLVLERYATSKIKSDEDLFSLSSYGFRWEALASIAEVSKITLLTKTAYAQIGTKMIKKGWEIITSHQPVGFEHWTIVSVEDLFFNVPARQKFLKSSQTEFFYCYNYFVDTAIIHRDKAWKLKKNDKIIFDLKPSPDLQTRIIELFKQNRQKNLKSFDLGNDNIHVQWVIWDASLRFWSRENIKIYVNSRPVQDKIISKAIMDAYHRQISAGEFPFVVLMLQIEPSLVDVNVHPAKINVKFANSQEVFELVNQAILTVLWENRFASVSNIVDLPKQYWEYKPSAPRNDYKSSMPNQLSFDKIFDKNPVPNSKVQSIFGLNDLVQEESTQYYHSDFWSFQIIGQLWNTYIVMQSEDALYYIDQHALAERIAYETMKKEENLTPEALLQPLKFEVLKIANLEDKIEELNSLWFEITMLGENVIAVYSVPSIFVKHPIDMPTLLNHVLLLEQITFDYLMDGIYASRACKTSIKAGHKLSLPQMEQLVQDWLEKIPWLFVCQHGRPFFWKIDKKEIDKLFDR